MWPSILLLMGLSLPPTILWAVALSIYGAPIYLVEKPVAEPLYHPQGQVHGEEAKMDLQPISAYVPIE